uniref:Uncharacterized protein n=1 Tax=Solanum lycopersicum TaxID=4081 RepID=A0A3Q7EX95_SOLLC
GKSVSKVRLYRLVGD